jgi:hypothetical protein
MQLNFAMCQEKEKKFRHKIVLLIICDVVYNILQLINVSGFVEMLVEKQNICNKMATWNYKTEENSEFFFPKYV